jgi:peptidyl-tRNA hydrolase
MADLDPGLGVHVEAAGADAWVRLRATATAVVRDGGLTEVTPGSETVLVLAVVTRRAQQPG